MKAYLLVAPMLMLGVWIFMAVRHNQMMKRIRKERVINPYFPEGDKKRHGKKTKVGPVMHAYNRHIKNSLSLYRGWMIMLLVFITAAIIFFILTAKPDTNEDVQQKPSNEHSF